MKGIKVEGMDHLAGQLKRVMATAQGQELQAALLAAAEEIRGEAARRAPIAPYPTRQNGREIAPGGLRASLKAAAGRKYKFFLQAFTFTLAKLAPHAHLVHFGTKPHAIVPGQGKSKK